MAKDISNRHVVKRYSLARIYDTTTGTYVDVAQLRAFTRAGVDVVVLDAKTGEDITSTFLRIGLERNS
jgi:polyhydroxyalkanoate synthesis regulator protein